jgi:ubiquinone/menaquinone biosynthesis C-methylase UbiE
MARTSERLTYAAAQAARVAFYGAHYLAARVIARDAFTSIEKLDHPIPSLGAVLKSMRALFAQDWANVEAGLYPAPFDWKRDVRRAMASVRFLTDIPKVAERQKRRGRSDLGAKGEGLPRYYRQNFHFQTDGYLSERSAQLYDFQVEALFGGTADAMRRRAYVPIARALEGRDAAHTTLLDIGAGTGQFLSFVKSVQPQLKTIALDLSEPYLAKARRVLKRGVPTKFVEAAAESMPLKNNSIDIAVSIFLFHELPPKVRVAAAKDIARVLQPDGIFVLADTIQYGDVPEFDGLIDVFPELLHEPYYAGFAKSDLDAIFGKNGLERVEQDIAYLTKVTVFRKKGAVRTTRARAAKGDAT